MFDFLVDIIDESDFGAEAQGEDALPTIGDEGFSTGPTLGSVLSSASPHCHARKHSHDKEGLPDDLVHDLCMLDEDLMIPPALPMARDTSGEVF